MVKLEMRHPGIWVFGKAIRHTLVQVMSHVGLAVYRESGVGAIRTQIIDTSHMVVVLMSDEQGIELGGIKPEHLRPEVRATIDK